jgi:hypothetical protein
MANVELMKSFGNPEEFAKNNEEFLVKIYTDKDLLKNKNGIDNVDSFFFSKVTDTNSFDEDEKTILKQFEKATITGSRQLLGRFNTEFLLEDLSSGVKALLLLSLIQNNKLTKVDYIDVTECGKNVLEVVFEKISQLKISAFIQHIEFRGIRDYNYLLNDKENIATTKELIRRIVRWKDE